MQKTKIEWTDYVWNPIKGICPVGCWYCYARRMYQRFKWDGGLRLKNDEFRQIYNLALYEFPFKVFVCSTIELFHPSIKKEWRDAIFKTIEKFPWLTFQILTKFPHLIDRPMPDNVWLGVTITGNDDFESKCYWLEKRKAKVKYWSLEPYFSDIFKPMIPGAWDIVAEKLNWIIIGRLTGYGKKYDPSKLMIERAVHRAKYANIPIFLKNNLKETWGEPLIQEMPKEA